MKTPKCYFLFFCVAFTITLHGQNKNNVWVFGDNAGVDFSVTTNPLPIPSHVISRGTCTNICNSTGQLLFYAAPDTDLFGGGSLKNGEINRPDGSIMPNGDSIVAAGWYYEMVVVPFPDDTNKFYVFSIGVTLNYGLWYSIVDMQQDSGKGAVLQKNVQLLNFAMVDCLTAIKHGNGRDWWVICRKSTYAQGTSNNTWYSCLITPSGISNVILQNVGYLNSTNSGRLCFNSEGNKVCFVNLISMIELYDFDRCTGVISNPVNIEPEVSVLPYPYYWSCAFSPSGQYLYVTSSKNPVSRLWQFDTWASNIDSTKKKVWQVSYPPYTVGALKLAPDNKIYLSCGWVDSSGNYTFPYDSTMYYPENMNLGVINSPDSFGAACNFLPWSFYLGGKRTYWGLPNNPDYDLGPVIGSACDSLRPAVNFAAIDTAICGTSCISFNDSSTKSPTRWHWFFTGAVPDTSSLQNPTNICYNNQGSYDVKLIACNGVGCDTLILSNYINVYPQPVVALGNDTATCNLPVQLDAGAGNTGYQWSNGDTTQTIIANISNTYTVTVTDANGCSNSDSVFVTINPLPVVALGNDTATCNLPVQLDAGTGSTGYQWSNGDTTQTITANITNTYTVTVTDANGCSNSDSVFVTINSLPLVTFNAFAFDTLCITQGVQTIGNGNPPGGSYSGTGVTGNTFNPTVAGMGWHNITYQFTDSLGCTNTITDSVWVDLCNGTAPLSLGEGSGVRLYPNPATEKIYFDISALAHKQKLVLTIYDAQGSLITSLKLKTPVTVYNLKQLTSGIYCYVVTDSSNCFSGKFAVTK